jgi:hypothetical protein
MSSAIQAKYASLCQLLGDLQYKKSQIEEQIEQISQEIYGLNFAQSVLLEADKADKLKKAQEEILKNMEKKN